jgi:NADPH-dependent curcumin reductase CurA
MNKRGRVAQCGVISGYDSAGGNSVPDPLMTIVANELNIRGFVVASYIQKYPEGIKQMAAWMRGGQIKYKEHVYVGFRDMPRALIEQLEGKNTGKVIVKR